MNGISIFTEQTPCAFCRVRTEQEASVYGPGGGLSPDPKPASTFILDFPGSTTVKNKFLVFICTPTYSIWSQQPKWAETSILL